MNDSLSNLSNVKGSKTRKWRRGQGLGTGNGKTAGKGQKGQGAHAHTKKRGFEGGQMPLARRLPKFGFKNLGGTRYATIDVSVLNRFEDGVTVTEELLIETQIVKKPLDGIKILAKGKDSLSKKLTVKTTACSASAKEQIEKAGGTFEGK